MRRRRDNLAARAHSFKENFLEALRQNSSPITSTPQRSSKSNKSSEKSFIQLAKKTNSTDNLTGHLGTARSTDCLIKEVQFALKYFEDAVAKKSYDMLPGCATVVLETLLAIQAFAGSVEDPMDPEVKKALDSSFISASHLTSWADKVIILGEVQHSDTVIEKIIEPVRKSVIVVVNLISVRIGSKNMTRGNSLPDITCDSPDIEDDIDAASNSTYGTAGLSFSSESILDISPVKPPLLPKLRSTDSAPPLPPKNLKPRIDKQIEDIISRSISFHNRDPMLCPNLYGLPGLKSSAAVRQTFENANKSLPLQQRQLNFDRNESSFLDQSFELMDVSDSPYNISKESVNNTSIDDIDPRGYLVRSQASSSNKTWSSKERSNTSSPSMESFASHLSDNQLDSYSGYNHHHHLHHHHGGGGQPPMVPRKQRPTTWTRQNGFSRNSTEQMPIAAYQPRRKLSEYDNVINPEKTLDLLTKLSLDDNLLRQDSHGHRLQHQLYNNRTWSEISDGNLSAEEDDRPPPLPPKKRNVMSYMEMFGKTMLPSGEDILHGFFQTHDLLHNVWQNNFHEYTEYAPTGLLNFPLMDMTNKKNSFSKNYVNHIPETLAAIPTSQTSQQLQFHDVPPALPPKRNRSRPGSFRSSSQGDERNIPIVREDIGMRMSLASDNSYSSSSSSETPKMAEITKLPRLSVNIPIERVPCTSKEEKSHDDCSVNGSESNNADDDVSESETSDVLQATDVSHLLVYGSTSENTGTSELRAGTIDALIVLATQTIKNDFLYQEAFLSTYRTFVDTETLIDKLVGRHRYFAAKSTASERNESTYRRCSRAAFSLLVRVVYGLSEVDFQDKVLLQKLTDFITSLIENGNLGLARALRSQFILKYEDIRARLLPDIDFVGVQTVGKRPTLLNFKSADLAEQMTLLDANLFMRLDSAELLNWVQEQSEEKSPNLTTFTEHFNNMSYWTRTLILSQPDAKEREKYVMKFIKIMKWLRKLNNFNSYLALLSALDSAPIRRLEWQRTITEGLKEYCSLIDSSSSFRAYRLALAESTPPCIPYIGLVLQDLTFVHIGNPHTFENKINFAKRWQQFNILDNLRRFKKVHYHITRNEDIIQFFANFEDFLTEDEMWNISETIKPRGQNKSK